MEVLSELIVWIRSMAPEVWAIYVRRQYVVAVVDLVWAVLYVGLAIASVRVFRWADPKYQDASRDEEDKWFVVNLLSIVVGSISVVAAPILLTGGIKRLLTLEYCAIQNLLSNLP